MIHSFKNLTLENLEDEDDKMEGNELEQFPQYIRPSKKGKQDLFGESTDRIKCLDAYVSDKPIDMEIDGDPKVLMQRKKETHQGPAAIIEATTELKSWA